MSNRRTFLVQCTMAVGAVTFLRPLNTLASIATNHSSGVANRLTLLHTANLNGQWRALGRFDRWAGLGGMEQLRKEIDQVRAEPTQVLVVDAGNLMTVQAENRQEQMLFYQAVARTGYDAVVPGRADLMRGLPYFRELATESRLPVVASHYERAALVSGSALPFYLLNKGNLQIGIIDGSAETLRKLPNYSLAKAVAAISRTAALLKEKNPCTLTIGLIQEEDAQSRRFAEASFDLDIIASAVPAKGWQNVVVIRNSRNEEVLLSRAGEKGTMMSRIDLTFNEQLEKTGIQTQAVLVGASPEKFAALMKSDRYPEG